MKLLFIPKIEKKMSQMTKMGHQNTFFRKSKTEKRFSHQNGKAKPRGFEDKKVVICTYASLKRGIKVASLSCASGT
jgi:hypothetical protein